MWWHPCFAVITPSFSPPPLQSPEALSAFLAVVRWRGGVVVRWRGDTLPRCAHASACPYARPDRVCPRCPRVRAPTRAQPAMLACTIAAALIASTLMVASTRLDRAFLWKRLPTRRCPSSPSACRGSRLATRTRPASGCSTWRPHSRGSLRMAPSSACFGSLARCRSTLARARRSRRMPPLGS